ncbi:nucleoside phosphorylase [Pantoea agglomerans]|uniref:phosphorylase family protein n=1 Tax=Enterobacter agglomerans TaxID=549 RepID=UPI0032084439
MNILILEDIPSKLEEIKICIKDTCNEAQIVEVIDWESYLRVINSRKFDLIISDLVVPRARGEKDTIDIARMLVDDSMDPKSPNLYTTVIALTQYGNIDTFENLNSKKIIVLSYTETSGWRSALTDIIKQNTPAPNYAFAIICALTKESEGFKHAGYEVGNPELIYGLDCQALTINGKKGLIVTCPRMGLVTASIISTKVLEHFKPSLICMAGICAGIEEKVNIYDVVIPEICHQHDFGKWGINGFEPEPYSVQLKNSIRAKIRHLINPVSFSQSLMAGLHPKRSEIPEGFEHISPKSLLAPASSGSAVIADENMNEIVKRQHRKMTAFEMESFSVYESARLAEFDVDFFSAKCVVDDGGKLKSDEFHRLACIISAKAVYEIIKHCF